MKRCTWFIALLVAVLGACASGKGGKDTSAPAASAPVVASSSSTTEAPVAPPDVPPPAAPDAPVKQSVGAPLASAGGPLIPPPEPGAARIALAGCLGDAEPSEASGGRFPVNTTRAPPVTPVTVTTLGNGAIITHALEHACCLQVSGTTSLEGKEVKVTETLTGQACRCRCSSTIKTAVGLGPGEYSLVVTLVHDGNTKVVHQGPVVVKRLGQ